MDWKNYVPNLNLYNLWHKSHRILAEGLAQLNKTRKVYFSTQIPIARLILATRNLHNAIHLHLYIGQHAPSSICGINGSKAPGETKLHVLCISNGDSHLLRDDKESALMIAPGDDGDHNNSVPVPLLILRQENKKQKETHFWHISLQAFVFNDWG